MRSPSEKKCLHCFTGTLAFPVWTHELDYLAKDSITTGGQTKYCSHLHQAIKELIDKQTFGPVQNVHKIFGPCQKLLDIWSYPKLFSTNQICSFWIGPNFKDLLSWTKSIMDVLDRAKSLLTKRTKKYICNAIST